MSGWRRTVIAAVAVQRSNDPASQVTRATSLSPLDQDRLDAFRLAVGPSGR